MGPEIQRGKGKSQDYSGANHPHWERRKDGSGEISLGKKLN